MRQITSLHDISGGRTHYQLNLFINGQTSDSEIEIFAMLTCNSATNNQYRRRVEEFQDLRRTAQATGVPQEYSISRRLRV